MKRDRAVWKSVGVSNIGELTKNSHHSSMGVTRQHESSSKTMALATDDMIDRQQSDLATKYQRQKPNIISNFSELSNRYNPNVHLTNRSGYNHNILSGHPNDYSSKLNISPREITEKVAFRKKGLTDIVN